MTTKFKVSLFVIVLLVLVLSIFFLVISKKESPDNQNRENTHVKIDNQTRNDTCAEYTLIYHKYYSLSYSEQHEQPFFVHYTLRKSQLGGNESRVNRFLPDSSIATLTANDLDYYKSGYDKGHLVPAADMNWSKEAMTETFLYSNISPQDPSFNRGIWKKLEEQVRKWAIEYDSIEIYAGPIFEKIKGYIGPNKVTVPGFYYKVLLVFKDSEYYGIGFIIPNEKSNKTIEYYSVAIDSVESRTNIDFYEKVPDSIEVTVESNMDTKLWFKTR